MTSATTTRDRFRGALLGLATGDVLGVPLEFKPPGTFEPVREIIGGGPFGLGPGEWTDDTSMALCLAESLLEKGRFDPIDQLERYCAWASHGHLSSIGRCFDIGSTVSQALANFRATGRADAGMTHERSAGNGSIMRLAPVPMFYWADPAEAVAKSGASSITTHAHPETVDACRYFGGLLWGALHGVSKAELLGECDSPVPGYQADAPLVPAIEAIANGSYKHKQPPAIVGSGYVVDSLEAALWAFYRSDSFEEGCRLAVNLGNDADTTGAVYGQLAGAFYGESGIPARWREKLVHRDWLEGFAERLYAHANRAARVAET